MLWAVLSFFLLISNSFSKMVEIGDSSSVTLSMKSYNVFDQNGESIESFYKVMPNSTLQIVLTDIPNYAHFVILQVHSYLLNVTLSYDKIPHFSTSVSGTNVGLHKVNRKSDVYFYLTYNTSGEEADVMLAVQGYTSNAPVPGGCNLEFEVEISPFLHTTYTDSFTQVDFAPASPPLANVGNLSLLSNNECNLKQFHINHEMYYRYFPERDITKETYFEMLKSMMTIGQIKKNGVIAKEKLSSLSMRRIFASYPGTGKAFVVVSYYGNHSAVYVPSVTYACTDLVESNNCQVLTTIFSKILCACILFVGLFSCFFGHYFYRIEIFLFGFFIIGSTSYILIWVFVSESLALSISVASGICLSGSILFVRGVFELPLTSLILATLNLGFVSASLIFFFLLDSVDLFVSDVNYWSVFVGLVTACPMLLIYLAEKANVISCSFVGSYVAVVSIDHYLGSNLRYICINTIRRAVEGQKFRMALIAPPFQVKDAILYSTWFLLTMCGIGVQRLLLRYKPPYPPPQNVFENSVGKVKKLVARNSGERTPLLNKNCENSQSREIA